jgi:hypothetical protein
VLFGECLDIHATVVEIDLLSEPPALSSRETGQVGEILFLNGFLCRLLFHLAFQLREDARRRTRDESVAG